MKHSLSAAFLLVIAAIAGAQAPAYRVDTIVRLAERPLHSGVATLVEEMSIGVADGEEQYMFGDISDIALGADGSIYVFDRQVPALRQYDAGGKFLRNIGRKGAGPGEYLSTSGIATTRDGRVLLWDTGNWRVNIYSASGDFVTQWLTPSGSSGSSTAMYSRALLLDTSSAVITRKIIIKPGDFRNRPTVWIRFRLDGTLIDTVVVPPAPHATAEVSATSGRASVSSEVPFAPKRITSMTPFGYLIAGYPDRYAFELHQPGKPVLSVRRDVKPEPVSRAERAEARKQIEDRMRQTDPMWSWNGPDIPDVKPLYADIQVGDDGRVWVALEPEVSRRIGNTSMSMGSGNGGPGAPPRQSAPPANPRPALYDVFEPDGRYLGQVQVPARVSSVVRRGDQVWAVAFDEEDVPRIKRYRIAWK